MSLLITDPTCFVQCSFLVFLYYHTCAYGHSMSQNTKYVHLNTYIIEGVWSHLNVNRQAV